MDFSEIAGAPAMSARLALLAALGICTGAAAQAGCADLPDACKIGTGAYHIALPEGATKAPVVMFLHGAGGNGRNVMRNTALVTSFTARGYAVIAPSAGTIVGSRFKGLWNFYPGREGRDDTAFLGAVVQDSAARFDLDTDNVLLTGFSAGAFMVTYLACATPEMFSAYAPIAGGFWRPHPDACAGPVALFQTHGWTDKTVPLEGRPLGGGRFIQGDIFAGMEIWRIANACPNMAPDAFTTTGRFMRRSWTDCAQGSALEFALFPGGHSIPRGWGDMTLDWYEALPD